MKKISMILMAFALAMMMSQCKKNEVQPTSNDEVVTITLDVKQNNGSKVVVNPNTGTVDFETGDKIYVGSGGKYVGFLTHNGTNFVGNITNPTENQPLQFYFLGNVTPQETLSADTTEECSVIISDQKEHLPVISCAASNENYVSGITAYSAHLLNKCALVKFNVTTPSNSPICITGMKNKVTVDFANNTLTPSQDGEGVIMLPAGSGENVEKWAILLPQEALEEGEEGSVYSEYGTYIGMRPAVPSITENGYFANGLVILASSPAPTGAINGLFSVSETQQVWFSRGNLQYLPTQRLWRFAENQFDYVGEFNSNISLICNIWIDLFGWGTSGWNNGNVYYQPYNSENRIDSNLGYGYGPTDGTNYNFDLTDTYSAADWGVYNAITNGGAMVNQWRTLTNEEWQYVLYYRYTSSEIRFAKAIVNSIKGVILFPDNWKSSIYMIEDANNPNAPFSVNEISETDWETLETAGAVFLPAAGYRVEKTVNGVGYSCFYWSSSHAISNPPYARGVDFINLNFACHRFYGLSVRLVQDY